MPPPPPPSKSYLLVLDSDSSDESEDGYRSYRQEDLPSHKNAPMITPSRLFDMGGNVFSQVAKQFSQPQAPTPVISQSSSSSSSSSKLAANNDHPPSPNQEKKLTKNQKKRLSKKKKKKAAYEQKQQVHDEKSSKRRVSFSNVAIREFPRAFSEDTVPGHGGWPLGMKLDGYEDLQKVPIEDYETSKQNQLHERWLEILSAQHKKAKGSPPSKNSSPSKKKKEKENNNSLIDEKIIQLVNGNNTTVSSDEKEDDDDATNCRTTIYESRQWDYRSRVKNPLFGLLTEDERHAIFLQASGADSGTTPDIPSPKASPRARRTRSNSFGNHQHNVNGPRRSRSNSFGNHDLGNSVKGKFNDEYSQARVHHVRNELEQLRFERSKSGATGCNCRKLVVYLPPKDGSGGKKSQHRRLKPSKVVQELKKRNLYDSSVASMSREEMEKLLHDAVEKEPCCQSSDCFCFRNGINCQADACSCWHDSHVHAKPTSGGSRNILSNEEIRKRCGNPLGTYLVDIEAIDRYRMDLINQSELFVCRPVTP